MTKAVMGSLGWSVGVGFLSLVTGADIAHWVATGTNLLSLKYSRANETEADERGVAFLKAAKIPTDGMISFFNRLHRESPGPLAKSLSILSTHPLSQERATHIQMLSEQGASEVSPELGVLLEDLQKK